MRSKRARSDRSIGGDASKCLIANSRLLGDSSDGTELTRNRLCITTSNRAGKSVITESECVVE